MESEEGGNFKERRGGCRRVRKGEGKGWGEEGEERGTLYGRRARSRVWERKGQREQVKSLPKREEEEEEEGLRKRGSGVSGEQGFQK